MVKGCNPFPTRSCLKKMGPRESRRIRKPTTRNKGKERTSPNRLAKRSKARLTVKGLPPHHRNNLSPQHQPLTAARLLPDQPQVVSTQPGNLAQNKATQRRI